MSKTRSSEFFPDNLHPGFHTWNRIDSIPLWVRFWKEATYVEEAVSLLHILPGLRFTAADAYIRILEILLRILAAEETWGEHLEPGHSCEEGGLCPKREIYKTAFDVLMDKVIGDAEPAFVEQLFNDRYRLGYTMGAFTGAVRHAKELHLHPFSERKRAQKMVRIVERLLRYFRHYKGAFSTPARQKHMRVLGHLKELLFLLVTLERDGAQTFLLDVVAGSDHTEALGPRIRDALRKLLEPQRPQDRLIIASPHTYTGSLTRLHLIFKELCPPKPAGL